MKLTENQKEFLLKFFHDKKFAGWKNIAESLLETGSCIVAGDECIWKGGIGNFIDTKSAPNLIGCSEYTFDVKNFMTSEWYKESLTTYKIETSIKLNELEESYKKEKSNLEEILNW